MKQTLPEQLRLAADIEQAKLDGKPKEWEIRHPSCPDVSWSNCNYDDWSPVRALDQGWEIRIKPAPARVPLTAADVPVGSVFAKTGELEYWAPPAIVCPNGVMLVNAQADLLIFPWKNLMDLGMQILRPGQDWQPCSKPAE